MGLDVAVNIGRQRFGHDPWQDGCAHARQPCPGELCHLGAAVAGGGHDRLGSLDVVELGMRCHGLQMRNGTDAVETRAMSMFGVFLVGEL